MYLLTFPAKRLLRTWSRLGGCLQIFSQAQSEIQNVYRIHHRVGSFFSFYGNDYIGKYHKLIINIQNRQESSSFLFSATISIPSEWYNSRKRIAQNSSLDVYWPWLIARSKTSFWLVQHRHQRIVPHATDQKEKTKKPKTYNILMHGNPFRLANVHHLLLVVQQARTRIPIIPNCLVFFPHMSFDDVTFFVSLFRSNIFTGRRRALLPSYVVVFDLFFECVSISHHNKNHNIETYVTTRAKIPFSWKTILRIARWITNGLTEAQEKWRTLFTRLSSFPHSVRDCSGLTFFFKKKSKESNVLGESWLTAAAIKKKGTWRMKMQMTRFRNIQTKWNSNDSDIDIHFKTSFFKKKFSLSTTRFCVWPRRKLACIR